MRQDKIVEKICSKCGEPIEVDQIIEPLIGRRVPHRCRYESPKVGKTWPPKMGALFKKLPN